MTNKIVILSYLTLIALLLLVSCNTAETKNKVQGNINHEKLDGYWVLTNYLDDIMITKSIGAHVIKKPLSWEGIVLKIKEDSLTAYGLIMTHRAQLSGSFDSLTTIKGLRSYQFQYEKWSGKIRAKQTNNPSQKSDTITYFFRRVREAEQRLVEGIDDKPANEKLEANFYSFFLDSLIIGKYNPLSKTRESGILELDKSGPISGFKSYNQYSMHDYFGLIHPCEGNDVLVFKDTTIVESGLAPPTNIDFYNWKFNGDTLVLTEMVTDNYECYRLGTKIFRFKKLN